MGKSAVLLLLVMAALGPDVVEGNPLDGRWDRFHRDPFAYAASVYVPASNRIFSVGGRDGSNFLTNQTQIAPWEDRIVWERLDTSGSLPPVWGHSLIHDSAHDRLLLFGGETNQGLSDAVWSLSLTGPAIWTPLVTTGTPPAPRSRHTAIYDPVTGRMIVFGGWTGVRRNDVWSLDLGAAVPQWSLIEPQSGVPPPREGHIAVYDAERRRMVIHGGLGNLGLRNDSFALSLDGVPLWEFLPAGPTGAGHLAAVDPAHGRVIVCGGTLGDPWSFSFAAGTWTQLNIGGQRPPSFDGCGAALNPGRDEFAVFGGTRSTSSFRIPLSTLGPWSKDDGAVFLPIPIADCAAILDPVRRRIVLAAGPELWQFPLDGPHYWTRLEALGGGPSARTNAAMVYDPEGDRAILYGGSGPHSLDDLWELRLSGTPTWALLESLSAPGPRSGVAAVYDPVRRRMLLDGGFGTIQEVCSVSGGITFLNHFYPRDVWSLDLGGTMAWTREVFGTSYEAHATIYDSQRDRFVRFGGVQVLGRCVSDGFGHPHPEYTYLLQDVVEELDPAGGTTTPLPHEPGPLPRAYLQAVIDPARDCAYAFGGGSEPFEALPNLWRWDLTTHSWSQLDPDGLQPEARNAHVMIFDEQRGELWMFGGVNDSSTWRYTPPDAPTPILATLAESHVDGGKAFLNWWVDPERAPVLRVQRRTRFSPWGDLAVVPTIDGSTFGIVDATIEPGVAYGYRLAWGDPRNESWAGEAWIQNSPSALRNGLRIEGASPVRGRIAIRVQLASPARAQVDLIDLRGRTIRTVPLDPRNGGDQIVELVPVGALPAGVYWARLVADGDLATVRLVYLP